MINQHRITFDDNGVEIEEFDDNDDFVSRVFLKHNDFKILIGSYRKYEENE